MVSSLAGQALRQDAEQGVGEVERVHAHVQQAGDGFGRAVGVQRGEHQVAGQRGFDAHADGFLVAHLADHDDVRVGAQEGAHHQREVDAGLAVDLHLAQALLRDFDRVLGGPDLGVRRVQELQHRVQRGGLARAGGAADEEQAVGLARPSSRGAPGCAAVPSLSAGSVRRRQDPHHDVFDAAGDGIVATRSSMSSGPYFLNLILPSCGLRARRCRGRT
jgi:hypothetical protein